MGTETERARLLLESSERLLEQSRNRPSYVGSWLDDRPQERAVAVPVRKTREDAAVSRTMDPQTQAGWDRWARSIAKAEAAAATERLAKITGEELGPWIRANSERIAELERRINELEQRAIGKVTPIARTAA